MAKISFINLIKKHETAEYPRVEESKEALANARAFVSEADENREQAEEAVEDIIASWTRLNSQHTANDYAVAVADIERTKAFAIGAERKVKAAERMVLNADTSLANAVADVIRLSLPEDAKTPVVATFLTDVADKPADLPLILVVQSKPAVRSAKGSLSGSVTVRYYRTSGHRPLDPWGILSAGDRDMGVRPGNVRENAASNIDTLDIEVMSIAPRVPLIADVSPADARILGSKIAKDIAVATLYSNEGVRAGTGNPNVLLTKHVSVTADRSLLVSETPDGNSRVITVDASVCWEQHMTLSGRTLMDIAKEKAEALTGQYVPGLGRIQSASIVSGESELFLNGDRRAILAATKVVNDFGTDTSKVGWENTGQIVVRCVIASAKG